MREACGNVQMLDPRQLVRRRRYRLFEVPVDRGAPNPRGPGSGSAPSAACRYSDRSCEPRVVSAYDQDIPRGVYSLIEKSYREGRGPIVPFCPSHLANAINDHRDGLPLECGVVPQGIGWCSNRSRVHQEMEFARDVFPKSKPKPMARVERYIVRSSAALGGAGRGQPTLAQSGRPTGLAPDPLCSSQLGDID